MSSLFYYSLSYFALSLSLSLLLFLQPFLIWFSFHEKRTYILCGISLPDAFVLVNSSPPLIRKMMRVNNWWPLWWRKNDASADSYNYCDGVEKWMMTFSDDSPPLFFCFFSFLMCDPVLMMIRFTLIVAIANRNSGGFTENPSDMHPV